MTTINYELHYANRPVANLAALKAIDTTIVVDAVTASVSSLGLWKFVRASSATADDVNIVAPTTGPGRWFRQTMQEFKVDGAGYIDNSILPVDLRNGTTATTQALGDNSTKLATTAYVDGSVIVENLLDRELISGSDYRLNTHNAGDRINVDSTAAYQINKVDILVSPGNYNLCIGEGANGALTSGTNNILIGKDTGNNCTTGSNNVHIGVEAGYTGTSAQYNTNIGYQAGYGNTNCSNNVCIGNIAGKGLSTGGYNVAIGSQALTQASTAVNNIGIGYQAGRINNGSANIFIGYQAGESNLTSSENVYIGYQAGTDATGAGNTCVGYTSGYSLLAANDVTAYGYSSAYSVTIGSGDFFGYNSGIDATVETNISCIGNSSLIGAHGSNSMVLGNSVQTVYIDGVGLKLKSGTYVDEFSTDGTLVGNSDLAIPTEKAVKTYIDNSISVENLWDRATTTLLPHNAGDDVSFGTGGLKDSNVTTAIKLGDASNTSINASIGTAASLLDGLNKTITAQYDEEKSGFISWGGSGNYYSFSGNTFTILRPGTGRIRGQLISWSAPQNIVVSDNVTAYIGINSSGTIVKIDYSAVVDSDFYDYIMLFEALYTGVTNNRNITVRENHDYSFSTQVSRYLNNNIGIVIQQGFGANITKIGTGTGASITDRQIKIVTTGYLDDHGLVSTVSDTAGSPISLYHCYQYTYWYTTALINVLENYYLSGATPALAGDGRYTVHVIYVSKEDLNSATPTYYATIHNADFANPTQAQNAINTGSVTFASNELNALELARLGYAVVSQSGGNSYIYSITISKSTPGSATIVGGGPATSHLLLSDLATGDSGHTQFALLAGRSGGQTLYGSDTASEHLVLDSTSDVTKGQVQIANGTVLHSNSTNYESLISADDDIPNKKYVDDAVGGSSYWTRATTYISTATANDSVQLGSTAAYYLGTNDTDGSWRIIRDGNDLSFERRESSVWVSKGKMLASP